jgi:hypothetical protein
VWPSAGGRRYFLLLVDDHSRYMWVLVLGSKGEVADAIRRTQAAAEAKCGRKLRVLCTDNGCEFTATEFASYCADQGIQPLLRTLQPVAERRRRAEKPDGCGDGRALLKQRGMPAVFWGEAVVTTVYILNRSPTKALEGRTLYEAWHGRKPAVSHLRVFGCLAFAKELGHVSRLDPSHRSSRKDGSRNDEPGMGTTFLMPFLPCGINFVPTFLPRTNDPGTRNAKSFPFRGD